MRGHSPSNGNAGDATARLIVENRILDVLDSAGLLAEQLPEHWEVTRLAWQMRREAIELRASNALRVVGPLAEEDRLTLISRLKHLLQAVRALEQALTAGQGQGGTGRNRRT